MARKRGGTRTMAMCPVCEHRVATEFVGRVGERFKKHGWCEGSHRPVADAVPEDSHGGVGMSRFEKRGATHVVRGGLPGQGRH